MYIPHVYGKKGENGPVLFLDMKVMHHTDGLFSYTWYNKPMDNGLIIICYVSLSATSLDAKERHWIHNLQTLTPQGLIDANTFHSQNRSSMKIIS